MVAPITGGMTVGQAEQAKSMIRLLKQYLSETRNDRARAQLARSVKEMADQLVGMPNAGMLPPPPWPMKPTPPPTPPGPPNQVISGWRCWWYGTDLPLTYERPPPPPPPPPPPRKP